MACLGNTLILLELPRKAPDYLTSPLRDRCLAVPGSQRCHRCWKGKCRWREPLNPRQSIPGSLTGQALANAPLSWGLRTSSVAKKHSIRSAESPIPPAFTMIDSTQTVPERTKAALYLPLLPEDDRSPGCKALTPEQKPPWWRHTQC